MYLTAVPFGPPPATREVRAAWEVSDARGDGAGPRVLPNVQDGTLGELGTWVCFRHFTFPERKRKEKRGWRFLCVIKRVVRIAGILQDRVLQIHDKIA